MQPIGQSMRSSKRPAMLLKPQTPMMDNSGMQQRTVTKQSKGFGTLPNMPKKYTGYQVEPSGWINDAPGRAVTPQDFANLESGFSTVQGVDQYQPQSQWQQFEAEIDRLSPPGYRERVAATKARAAAEDMQPEFPMYVGGGDENNGWSIKRALSPEESSQRLKDYMAESKRTREQALLDLKELGTNQEIKHQFWKNKERAALGLPPIRSFNRAQFAPQQQPMQQAPQQAMPQYQPQFMPQPMQQPMAPQPMPQRPPVDVDQLIDHWNNIQGPKAPLAHFIENSKRSAGELPSFIPPDAQAMMNSPSGGPVGAPGGYSQPEVSNPMVRNAISQFFMNGMRGNNAQMNNQERMLNQRGRMNQVDSMMGNVGAPVMGGLMSMFTGNAAGNEMAQDWNNRGYQRGNDLMNQRNQFINNAQQNTRDGFSMMQSADPNTMKNQIAMMNAQANAQRANSYGQQVGNSYQLGQGRLGFDYNKLNQGGQEFQQQMRFKQQEMDQQLRVHMDNIKLRAQSNQISQQQADQEMQIAVMRNQQAQQQMAQQMQIATMGNAAQLRGQDFSAYNNYLGDQSRNQQAAADLWYDKEGNAHPANADWFNQRFGAPAPQVQPEQQSPSGFFGMFGGQPQQPQNPAMSAAMQHYQALPPQQRAGLRQQFIQKFGQDPGN